MIDHKAPPCWAVHAGFVHERSGTGQRYPVIASRAASPGF
jgi:hypothetical protein